MKKVIILILFLLVFTGCSKENIDINNYEMIFNTFLSKDTSLVNNYSTGYKYYLPTGVKVLDSKDYNDKLYYNGEYYYLFVDIVNYYYKNDIDYEIVSNALFSKILEYNGKKGYVQILKVDDLYKIEVYYNYAKIESYVSHDNIGQSLINICYILNSIKFNDAVIELSMGDDATVLKEEVYDFFTPRKKEGNFIDYIRLYDEYKDITDENNIGNKGNE
ncbi:MAG: membrane lipoprotein lipid attachment site-containing protein [Bacilli bacterium]|nr:membrane lipoprotein lipid attachment site-containing protein [Bacilli bacterium]